MNEVIKEYHKFNAFGDDKILVSEEDQDRLAKLLAREVKFRSFKLNQLVIETYSDYHKVNIFNKLKARQGQKTRITFINDRGYPVEILSAKEDNKYGVVLNCVFCRTRKNFSMYLSTFISEYKLNNITKLYPKKFAKYYFESISEALDEIKREQKIIEEKYNDLYYKKAAEVKRNYNEELKQYPKQERHKKKYYELSSQEIIKKAAKYIGVQKVKNYWNTKLSEEEKTTLLNWVAKNIYSIRVYGVIDGRSGNVLSQDYSDVEGVKLREVKRDDENQIISNDNITAHISFKTLEGAPREIFEKIVSPKRRSKNIFYNNRLNDKNLALFLLAEYKDKGFKAGVRNLYREITL